MPKILVVEDDIELSQRLSAVLQANAYEVDVVSFGEDALQMLHNYHFSLVVLDWDLPDISGLEVCIKFRKSGGKTPILFLTGRGEIDDKESGLDHGADDFLVKPFIERELLARIRTLLRRPFDLQADLLSAQGVELDPQKRILKTESAELRLTARESAVIEFLMRRTDRIYSAKSLLDAAWPTDSDSLEQSVRTLMKTLRHKLVAIGLSDFITTVAGAGYTIQSTEKVAGAQNARPD